MYVFNSCKYDEYEISMYGQRHIGCVHPMRKSLDGFFDKILGIFTKRRPCAAVLGHERYCPYYKCKYPRPSMPPSLPSMNPFSNKTTPLLDKEKEQAVKSWNKREE